MRLPGYASSHASRAHTRSMRSICRGYGLSGLPQGYTLATLAEMRGLLEAFLRTVIEVPTLVVGSSLSGWLAVQLAWLRRTGSAGSSC